MHTGIRKRDEVKMSDLVSVIMSTYNEELKWIKESVNSILDQTYANFELIIILDNPGNMLLRNLLEEYAAKDNRIRLIINRENIGLVKSLNIALKHCNGKYIARMDADDISDKERLNNQKDYVEKNNLDFVFSGMKIIDEQSIELYETNENIMDSYKTKKLLQITNISNHPTWFLKAEIYKKLGGYREVSYCEDYDFSLRCLSRGYKIGRMNRNVIKYRIRANSVSRSYSLEQFIISRGILKLYKNNELEDFKIVSDLIIKSQELANDKEKEKYIKADRKTNEAINLIKNGRPLRGIVEITRSVILSKYCMMKYTDFLKYKISGL